MSLPYYIVDSSGNNPIATLIERTDNGNFVRPVVVKKIYKTGAIVSKQFNGGEYFFASNQKLFAGRAVYNTL